MSDVNNHDLEDEDAVVTSSEEERARRNGWRPEEEFDDSMVGKPKEFLTAEAYNEKIDTEIPILRDRNRHLSDTIGKLEGKLGDATTELKNTSGRIDELGSLVEDLHKSNKEVGERAYKKAEKDINERLSQAVEDGDKSEVQEIIEERDDLQRTRAPEPKPVEEEKKAEEHATPETNPTTQAWIEKNQDIMGDPVMGKVAYGLYDAYSADGKPEVDVLAEIHKEIHNRYSDRFENPARKKANTVGGSSPPAGSEQDGDKKTFSNLPESAQRTYASLARQFESKGRKYSKAEYAKDYFIEQEQR